MYLTTRKQGPSSENTEASRSVIDALFAGVTDIDVSELQVINTDEDSRLYRTVTQVLERDEITTHRVTQEMMRMANHMIMMRTNAHPNPESEYDTFQIPKKTHGFRTINAPQEQLKKDQKDVAATLAFYLKTLTHDSAWAYVTGRDVVHAMKEHVGNNSRWYLKLDLHDFFGSCSPEFIKTQLKKLYPFGYYECDEMIDNIIKIAILNNGLPQGTPLSPLLTNLIMVEFDYKINRRLYELTKEDKLLQQKYIYTRYADDIIISARNKFEYQVIIDMLKELFEGTPLQLNEEKTRFGSNAGRNWNLGIMCNKDNNLTVGYRRKHQLKSIIHNYITDKKNGTDWILQDLYWLQGQLSWLYNVEPEYFNGIINYMNTKHNINLMDSIKRDIKILSTN